MLEGVQEVDAVLVVFENGLFFIAARGDVLDSAGALKLLQRQRIESSIHAEEFIVFAR
jgi:hypothetical protein